MLDHTRPLQIALGVGIDPARETVGNVAGVAAGAVGAEVVGDVARVVHAGGAVKRRDVAAAGGVEALRQAVAVVGAGRALADHRLNGAAGTRRLDVAVVVAGAGAVVVLHQARVAVVVAARGVDANAAGRLLHDDGEDEAVVDASL